MTTTVTPTKPSKTLLSAVLSLLTTLPNAISLALPSTLLGLSSSSSSSSTNNNTNNNNGAKIGFVGCGTIASAMVQGIATQTDVEIASIAVSRRSQRNSERLAREFAHLVTVYDDNQEIVQVADILFLTVLPEQTQQVLQSLDFDKDRHSLVSLVSTAKLSDLSRDSGLDPSRVSKMICLPSIAHHQGVCLHCAPSSSSSDDTKSLLLTQLFQACGGVVTLTTEAELEAAMVTTCIMGPLYGLLQQTQQWVLRNTSTLTSRDATYLVLQQYLSAVQDAAQRDSYDLEHLLQDMIAEQTPGGLNEQALGNLKSLGGLEAQDKVMDALLARIRGTSNGSLE